MKLYYSKGAASLAVRILINEINLPCQYEAVDLKTKITETGDDYFKITSKGYVPALKIEANVITETAIILQYLAEHHQATTLLPELGHDYRYRVLEWVNFIATELHKNVAVLLNPNISDEAKPVLFKAGLNVKLNWVNDHLSNKPYLMGNQFTIADAYLFTILFWLPQFLNKELSQWPHLQDYYAKLNERSAIQKSLREEKIEDTVEV